MNQEKMIELVQRQLEAYNKRSLEVFVSCFHPKIRVQDLLDGRPDLIGIEAFTKTYRALFESNPDLKCELRSRIVLESTIIDEEWITGAKKYPKGLHAVAIYAFGDGLIDRVWFPR